MTTAVSHSVSELLTQSLTSTVIHSLIQSVAQSVTRSNQIKSNQILFRNNKDTYTLAIKTKTKSVVTWWSHDPKT